MLWINLRRGTIVSAVFFILLGLAYPLAATGIGNVLFPRQAQGSIGPDGSQIIGQPWVGDAWFHGRPDCYDPSATGGSALGPRSEELLDTYRDRVAGLASEGITPEPDLVASSGSGLDPDISPVAAYAQAAAVAKARGIPEEQVRDLISAHVHGPQWGFLGAAHVNVMGLNQALAALP